MIKVIIISLILGLPATSMACSPPAVPMSPEEYLKWNEANPCPLDVDIERYETLKKECVEKAGNSAKADNKILLECNHEAYIKSERKPQPNPDYKP